MMALLQIDKLRVEFEGPSGRVAVVRGIDLEIGEGDCVAVVGESGSGKSQALLACAGLLAANGSASGSVRFDGEQILGLPERSLQRLRGPGLGFIFQDSLSGLTPHLRVGDQLVESLTAHRAVSRREALGEARTMLERVQVSDAARRLSQYPHELSGGTRQRVAIAAALMPRPRLLIADEPTTALDVTVQAQVIQLLRELRREFGMTLVIVTHDLGVVAGLADRVVVMYAGSIVEEAATSRLFRSPCHPYAAGLLAALPRLDDPLGQPMRTVPGAPPPPDRLPPGCAFAPRCAFRTRSCEEQAPALGAGPLDRVACHHPLAGSAGP
jgi:oligopeptide transport system ATP-binding protein